MTQSPMDLFKIIFPKIVRKHPDWSTARCIQCTKWAVDHPDWKKEKTEQSDDEIFTPNQISFEDLIIRGNTYA